MIPSDTFAAVVLADLVISLDAKLEIMPAKAIIDAANHIKESFALSDDDWVTPLVREFYEFMDKHMRERAAVAEPLLQSYKPKD